jgi:hypothetical protein
LCECRWESSTAHDQRKNSTEASSGLRAAYAEKMNGRLPTQQHWPGSEIESEAPSQRFIRFFCNFLNPSGSFLLKSERHLVVRPVVPDNLVSLPIALDEEGPTFTDQNLLSLKYSLPPGMKRKPAARHHGNGKQSRNRNQPGINQESGSR